MHILIEKAHSYENVETNHTPKNCSYDRDSGLWRTNENQEIMMISSLARKPHSKKWDIETGEDQKGE